MDFVENLLLRKKTISSTYVGKKMADLDDSSFYFAVERKHQQYMYVSYNYDFYGDFICLLHLTANILIYIRKYM